MTAPATAHHWLDDVHPEFAKLSPRWQYTRDHYTAELLEPGKIGSYLHRKAVGESDESYGERQRLADYTNFFAAVVDSLSGMLWASDAKANRRWAGAGGGFDFGNPDDQRTLIGRLFRDADGRGLPYITLWKGATVDLLLDHRVWVLADTMVVDGTGVMRTVLRILPALSVPNWGIDAKGLADVVVKEDDTGPQSVQQKGRRVERRIVYTRTGWQRWEKPEGGAWTAGEQGTYRYTNPVGGAALPVFRVDLPLGRHVGWILAKKQNAIFNQESARDNLIRVANFPRLNIVADDTHFDKTVDLLRKGSNALQVKPGETPHGYISPETGPATIASEVLNTKREDFFTAALREYGDAARQRTATEVRQDVAQGVGAFLSLVASALDAAENGALWRLAQTERPDTPAAAVQARVERSDDFATVDPEAAIDKLRERVFGAGVAVPLGNEGRVQAALQVAAYLGLKVEEDEVRQAVALAGATDTLKAYQGLPLVAPVRVQLLKLLLQSTQLLEGAEATEMADGTERPSLTAVLAQALELAEAEDEQARRGGEFLGAPGPLQIPPAGPPPPPAGAAAE
jgi:hypothetical protein